MSRDEAKAWVHVLRKAGFAAWLRQVGADAVGPPHVHALPLGAQVLSAREQLQVESYRLGRDGTPRNGVDPDEDVGRPRPAWDALATLDG